jgi:hypothetical protein
MASIYKRKNENGTTVWRAVIRIKGYPSIPTGRARTFGLDDLKHVIRVFGIGCSKDDSNNQEIQQLEEK